MNIVVNCLPLKTGGGVQVGLDFLNQVDQHGSEHNWWLVIRQGSPFESLRLSSNIKLLRSVKDTILSRLFFEWFGSRKALQDLEADVVFTVFGPQWPGASHFVNVVGCAYSNLFYPEIDFWNSLPLRRRFWKKLVDRVRLSRFLQADVRIMESEVLAQRAIDLYSLPTNTVFCVKAAASSLVSITAEHRETKERCEHLPSCRKVLLISGFQENKNISTLKEAALHYKRSGIDDVCFVLTLPKEQPEVRKFMSEVRAQGLEGHIYNFGSVPQQGCSELYRQCDLVVLPSTLESFSNTIAESWAMKKPLIISDLDWARSLCGDGAMYFRHKDAEDLTSVIDRLFSNPEHIESIIRKGSQRLAQYPSAEERFGNYQQIIVEAASS